MTERYLEDFAIGQAFGSGKIRIDKERAKAFAAEFDPQPFHLDEEAARSTIFHGLAASGWHTAAVTMRLLVDSEIKPAGGIVGAGFEEFRWPYPVRPGDELRIESEILEVRPSKSRPEQGLIKVRTTTLNQDGKAVQNSHRESSCAASEMTSARSDQSMLRDINRKKAAPAMSALPPKADMCGATWYVRFVPIADIKLLDHFVRPGKHCRRNCEAQCLRGLEIDDKFVLVRCLHWQIGGFLTFEDTIHVTSGEAVLVNPIRAQ